MCLTSIMTNKYFNPSELFVCPVCKGKLNPDGASVSCTKCTITFKRENDCFCFFCKELFPSQEDYERQKEIVDFWGMGWRKRFRAKEHGYLQYDNECLKKFIEDEIDFNKKHNFLFGHEIDLETIASKVCLNIGCGAATESLILSYHGVYCIAMDITKEATQETTVQMKKNNSNCFGVQADSRYNPLATDTIDLVYSSGVLHHSPNMSKSVSEIYRVLKVGGNAYIMLYATWSYQFMKQRLKGILKGNITKKQQKEFMSRDGEKAWRTDNNKNPCTDTFTFEECRYLFKNFRRVSIRKGSFSLSQVPLVRKFLFFLGIKGDGPSRLENRLAKYIGACIFIKAEK